ncbi:endo-alpha-N-acetylgalactosaminidase family protein [Clostridium tarantellae]|nr:endo-alpha-N-acetylgalactosaminidase family protein [Clostridium tarantellae]
MGKNSKPMSKKLAMIVAAAVVITQVASVTTPVFANANENLAQTETLNCDPYTIIFDGTENIDWKTFEGKGTAISNDGWLEFKRDSSGGNNYTIYDPNAPMLVDGEAEMVFKVGKDARFGIVVRPSEENYLMLGYDLNSNWRISTKNGGKDFTGPKLTAGEEYKLQVRYEGNHIKMILDSETIFDEEVNLDGMPINQGYGIGFKTWYGSTPSYVQYVKSGPLGSIIDCESKEVKSVEPVEVNSLVGVKPELPTRVKVTYVDESNGFEEVTWPYISKDKYTKPGTFEIEGSLIKDSTKKVPATITVREDGLVYTTDFNTPETSGNWTTSRGNATSTVENNRLKVALNGVTEIFDEASPNIVNGSLESKFEYNIDTGRLGFVFRYVDENNWSSICYDAGNWIWKNFSDGKETYGNFGSNNIPLEANTVYDIKLTFNDSNVGLWVNGEAVGEQSINAIPTVAGKIGLHGWGSNKNVYLDDITFKEIKDDLLAPPESGDPITIESEDMIVTLDTKFPKVTKYEWKADNEILDGEDEQLYIVEVNGKKQVPEITSNKIDEKTLEYTLNFENLNVVVKVNMFLKDDNILRMEITDVFEHGDFKVKTINFPDHSLASVRNTNGGEVSAVINDGSWNNIAEDFKSVNDYKNGNFGRAYAFVNDNRFSIGINNNVVEGGARAVVNVQEREDHRKAGLYNGTFIYREDSINGVEVKEEMPWSEIMIARDTNKDSEIDWQDAAILYRENMNVTQGAEYIPNSLSYIPFNIGSLAQSPFLRTADQIKKVSNYTDGFGQLILEKGYQGEGHDDVIADIGGHTGIRQGGKDDLNKLIEIGKDYNAQVGVHVNVTEYHLDAFELEVDNLQPGFKNGWGWKDESYYVDQRKDITSGELERRFNMLKEDHPDLGWIYIDVYTGNGWNAKELAKVINGHDWMLATEFNGPLEQQVTWTHWGGDPAYPNRGNESDIIRFIRNQEQDAYMADDMLKGGKHMLSGGWGTRHDLEGFYAIETFYNQTLPSKYMQHFEIMDWEDDGTTGHVKFNDGLEVKRENGIINMYQDEKLIATTPKNTINDRGIGKTTLFMPWTWEQLEGTEQNKVYHWNPYGGETTWNIPNIWEGATSVKVYELSDQGRTHTFDIPVVDGKVTIDAKQNIPYVVFPSDEVVKESRITTWGEGTLINDPGFDSENITDNWTVESTGDNTDHINRVNEKVERRSGNDITVVQGNNGADATLSQEITDLVPGETYSASVWVKLDGDRKVTLGVDCGGETSESTIDRQTNRVGVGEGFKWYNDKFTRMRVEFTVPEDITTAKLYLNVASDEDDSKVSIDDFRIWTNPHKEMEPTNKDGYVLYEDFENVDEGHGPFYMGRNLGTDNRTHFAEKNPDGDQYMNWVIDGRFSLKTNQQEGTTGEMLVTDQTTLQLKPNTKYEIGFKYTNKKDNLYSIALKSPTAGVLFDENLAPGQVTGRPEDGSAYSREVKEFKHEFTTGNANDYYLALEKVNGFDELILDNLYIKEVKVSDATPNKPTSFKTIESTDNSITLSWKAPKNTEIADYTIYKDGVEIAKVAGTEFTATDLKSNTLYGFKVVANGVNGKKSRPIALNARTLKTTKLSASILMNIKNLFS